MGSYRFKTQWIIQAPGDRVWQAIVDTEEWPSWWKGVVAAEILHPGAADGVGQRIRYVFRSVLPYTLSFEVVLREVSRPHLLVGDASGELEGFGRWDIATDGGVTTLENTWHVRTTGAAMNMLAPFLRPAFEWSHSVAMRWGAEGLARHLNAPLLGVTSTPNPRLAAVTPLVGLLALLALAARRWRRRVRRHANGRGRSS